VAIAVVLVVSLPGSAPTRTDRVALSALAGTPASSHATAVIAGSRRVQVDVQYLPPAAAGHHYELWLMTDTTHLVPVASFGVSRAGTARLSLPLPAPPSRYRYLNVSLQQAGESAISNVSVLRGPIGGA
jgi:anti-sigma-K factor RskA